MTVILLIYPFYVSPKGWDRHFHAYEIITWDML